ncbi:hypothetical protein B0H19DRAFT_1257971 [Mycena capillaripes]|nr:hypothetical protein B0H19DRAFT_1257971 [Mycena capillaripes]
MLTGANSYAKTVTTHHLSPSHRADTDESIDVGTLECTLLSNFAQPKRDLGLEQISRAGYGALFGLHLGRFLGASNGLASSFATLIANYKSIALPDIQTTKARIGNRVSQVLFDLTTHTSSGDSGVGDHGQDGIATFVEQHVCTSRCESLGLVPLGDQDEEGDNEDDDE